MAAPDWTMASFGPTVVSAVTSAWNSVQVFGGSAIPAALNRSVL
jgi:hypothetical protein